MNFIHRSNLTCALVAGAASLAVMMMPPATVHAETVTAVGNDGANGYDNFDLDNFGNSLSAGSGDAGESVAASAGNLYPITSPLNNATAIGGIGGNGGNNFAVVPCCGFFGGLPGNGGKGGDAEATAATTILSGSAEADAVSTGGNGGIGGQNPLYVLPSSDGGSGGAATASATGSTGSGNATASATAKGGDGGQGPDVGGNGGSANASSTAITTAGSGDAVSSANATGGAPGGDFDAHNNTVGNATAMANASAAGGGTATAKAVATSGQVLYPNPTLASATATSNAVTVNGAMAQALSIVVGSGFEPQLQATSTAKTSFAGVSVQSTAFVNGSFSGTTMTDAIAQGRSGQPALDPSETDAVIATVLPDKAYAATLIGGASNVAAALLAPRDKIFGTAILSGSAGDSLASTFDFRFPGDLILGVVAGFDFDIIVNGAEIFVGGSVTDTVIDLGSNFGPDLDLTINGFGTFAFGGVVPENAVPETSTWAMMLLGFAGLGFAGYRSTRRGRAVGLAA
jgi:hypothetical protein